MRARRGPKADGGKKHHDEKRHRNEQERNLSLPAGARQPRQVNQRESDDPECESELDGQKNQRADRRQVGADPQAEECDA